MPAAFHTALDSLPSPSATPIETGAMRASAVLIAITDVDDQPAVLLTKRSEQLRNHRGEISFPGGRMDPGETPADAATREAFEEVGVLPHQLSIRGQLGAHRTAVSNSHIAPIVVGIDTGVALHPNPAEVAHAFWVPLRALAASGNHHSELWTRDTEVHVVHFFDLEFLDDPISGEVVWGATARMLVDLFDALATGGRGHLDRNRGNDLGRVE